MIIYYDWSLSPNCFKTKILLNELGIEYEQRDVDRGVMQSPGYSNFPAREAPALQDGDLFISESGAIALYLSEKFAGPVPKDPGRRALMLRAMFYEASSLSAVVGGRGFFGELFKPEAERDARRMEALAGEAQVVCRVLGEMLGEREYFAGEFSLADIQLYAGTTKAIEHGVFRAPPRNLLGWNERVGKRPSVVAARQGYVPYRAQ
jgi:glutathione S-transferase